MKNITIIERKSSREESLPLSLGHLPAFEKVKKAVKKISSSLSARKIYPDQRDSRRKSTACGKQYPFWLIPVSTLLELYGSPHDDGSLRVVDAHQVLRERGCLVRWADVADSKTDVHIIFVSHEWAGWNHCDPEGIQIHTLCSMLSRLMLGSVESVKTDIDFRLWADINVVTKAKEWKTILRDAYVWFDWISMPQPTQKTDMHGHHYSSKQMKDISVECKRALASIPSYVERSDFVLVLAPECMHQQRIDPYTNKRVRMSYTTWRTRGWCVLELLSSALSRDKSYPDD